jgi:hypothetical protein
MKYQLYLLAWRTSTTSAHSLQLVMVTSGKSCRLSHKTKCSKRVSVLSKFILLLVKELSCFNFIWFQLKPLLFISMLAVALSYAFTALGGGSKINLVFISMTGVLLINVIQNYKFSFRGQGGHSVAFGENLCKIGIGMNTSITGKYIHTHCICTSIYFLVI